MMIASGFHPSESGGPVTDESCLAYRRKREGS